jgi:hypothetical protein
MELSALAEHTAAVAGLAATIGVVLRYSPRAAHAALWLVAGITVIFGRSERSRVDRSVDVLRALRGLDPLSPEGESDTSRKESAGGHSRDREGTGVVVAQVAGWSGAMPEKIRADYRKRPASRR